MANSRSLLPHTSCLGLASLLSALVACGGDTTDNAKAGLPECGEVPADPGQCGVCTTQGFVEGRPEGSSCQYLGMPYAQPPAGALRFAAPVAGEPWEGVLSAGEYGAACPQGQPLLAGGASTDEDCLFINVHAPADPPQAPLPVMVFIHGGGNTGGTTGTYDGRAISEAGPVVVVTMNYRLGALGFFSHPALDDERGQGPAGNDGILDQQLAMRWVQDNILAFGGDPDEVTVFGESAGSTDTGVHLVSPLSAGLAHRYLMESGVPLSRAASGGGRFSREARHAATSAMVDDLCAGEDDVMACLREVPANTLMNWSGADGGPDWGPMIDGDGGVLPQAPATILERGDANPGEVLLGTNENEQGLFQLLQGSVSTLEELEAEIARDYPDDVEAILALYGGAGLSPGDMQVQWLTDVRFRCATRRMARLAAEAGHDVYLYSFEQGQAWHADELGYVFGGSEFYTLAIGQPVQPLVDAVQGYWLNFAETGNPNGPSLPQWPSYDAAGDEHMVLVDPPSAASGLAAERCDYWDAQPPPASTAMQ